MASAIKKDGKVGKLLTRIANRGGRMTSDYSGFPPAKVMIPLRKRGLLTMRRQPSGPSMRYSVWTMTDKAWEALGRTRPVED